MKLSNRLAASLLKLSRILVQLYLHVTSYPMTETAEPGFKDVVSGKRVHYMRDRYGRDFLAESRWNQFRVRVRSRRVTWPRLRKYRSLFRSSVIVSGGDLKSGIVR